MKRNNLMTGALIMSVGGVMAKLFSAIYRIAITRILGGEGIGLYQLVFPFYSLCVVLATAGLPMAISKVIAKNKNSEKSVLKKCLLFTTLISLVLTFILLISSRSMAHIQGVDDISICYMILAPSIIIVSTSSVLRGFFQGKRNFTPSAVSNIVEQFVKLVVGLVLSLSLISLGILPALIGAFVSIVFSEIISIIVLFVYYKRYTPKDECEKELPMNNLIKDILPIVFTNMIMPIAVFIDSLIVVNLLAVNFTRPMSIFMYGLESGAVSSLATLPTIFSFAIASVILPSITMRSSNFNKNHQLSLAIKIILILSIPFTLLFVLIPDRLIELLYSNRLNGLGVEGLNISCRLLAISGIGVVFLAINQAYSSSLQAIELRYVTIRNLTLAVIVKFIIEMIFLPSVLVNIYALSIANTACYLTAMILNHLEIKNHFNLSISSKFYTKLFFSNLLMTLALITVLVFNNSWQNTILALSVAGIVYLASLFYSKIFSDKDRAMLKYKLK